MTTHRSPIRTSVLLALLGGCVLSAGCVVEEEPSVLAIDTPGNLLVLPLPPPIPMPGDDLPPGPPPPAPPSVVDPHEPWDSLGELSGRYAVDVTRLESNCTRGPDVPFIAPTSRWNDPLDPATEFRVWQDHYTGYLTQRGDTVGLEIGEGILFGTWASESGRLIDVVRHGGAGVTHYFDGFEVELPEGDDHAVRIAGESDWEFVDHHYVPGEVCQGRTFWEAERLTRNVSEYYRDLQIVLRWPRESRADLDLLVEYPKRDDPLGSYLDEPDRHTDFARGYRGCYSIHSVGEAPDEGGFVDAFDDTALPYHEEVIRCSSAAYGYWTFGVVNWSADESAEYEIETFWGKGVNTGEPRERSFGTVQSGIEPLQRVDHDFVLTPPTSPDGTAGLVVWSTYYRPKPVARPIGVLTGTYLEFHRASWAGLRYGAYLDALGIGGP